MRPALAHTVNAILLLGLGAGSVWAFPRLPARVPTHYGLCAQAGTYVVGTTAATGLPGTVAEKVA